MADILLPSLDWDNIDDTQNELEIALVGTNTDYVKAYVNYYKLLAMRVIVEAYTRHYLCYPNVQSLEYNGTISNIYNDDVVKDSYDWTVTFGNDMNGDSEVNEKEESLQLLSVKIKENNGGTTFTCVAVYSNGLFYKITPAESTIAQMVNDKTLTLQEGIREAMLAYFDNESHFSEIIANKVGNQSAVSLDLVKSKISK